MPRRLEAAQQKELTAFVLRLRDLSRAPSDAEFARRAGVHWAQFSKWKRELGGLDGWNLYLMIREVARANQSEPVATAVAAGSPGQEDPLVLLRGLSSVVAESQATNEAILERLERLEHALEARSPDVEGPLSADGG